MDQWLLMAQGVSLDEQVAFWSYLDEAGEAFSRAIIDYVNANYTKYIPITFPHIKLSRSQLIPLCRQHLPWLCGNMVQLTRQEYLKMPPG